MGLGFRNFPQDGLGRHIATLDGLIWPWAAFYVVQEDQKSPLTAFEAKFSQKYLPYPHLLRLGLCP